MNKSALIAAACIGLAAPASAQAPPDYDFNFITIGATDNASYTGFDPLNEVTNRGAVNYEYRMARTEVTTAQYVEFINAWASSGGGIFDMHPILWGAESDGFRWSVIPGRELQPLAGVSWREAAHFVNWLHNGKQTDNMDSFLSGVYDVSTFGAVPNSQDVTDQSTHSPDAKYWIPTLDESMKSTHYDPNKNGPGQGGWWLFNDSSETQPVPGYPGVGESSAGMKTSTSDALEILLEAYPDTQTPWGLLDASGGAAEHTEEWFRGERESRLWRGNPAGSNFGVPGDLIPSVDQVWRTGSARPRIGSTFVSFRIASAVPTPGVGVALMCGIGVFIQRRRRYE